MQSTFQKALTNTLKNLLKKWPTNGPLSCYGIEFNVKDTLFDKNDRAIYKERKMKVSNSKLRLVFWCQKV